MSGEGALPNAADAHAAMMRAAATPPEIRSGEEERADVLAYLDRKVANADKMISRSAEFSETAAASKRAWEIARDDIQGGLHVGETDLRAGQDQEHA